MSLWPGYGWRVESGLALFLFSARPVFPGAGVRAANPVHPVDTFRTAIARMQDDVRI
jgi:hypothetical protein